jgi:hypothetical protein
MVAATTSTIPRIITYSKNPTGGKTPISRSGGRTFNADDDVDRTLPLKLDPTNADTDTADTKRATTTFIIIIIVVTADIRQWL